MGTIPTYILTAALPLIAAGGSGSVALYAWQRREVNGARAFAVCTGSVFIWCFFAVFEQLAQTELAQIVFGKLQYFGIAPFPVLWCLFTLRYTQRDGWIRPRTLKLSIAVPLMSIALALTDRWHGWVWKIAEFSDTPYPHLKIEHGWWFNYVMVPHCYLLLLIGFGVLLSASFSGSRLFRQQTLVLLIASLAPFVSNVLYVVSDVTLYGLDLTPVGFAIAALLVHIGLFHAKFLDIAPISYKTVFLNTADAVILLDIHQRIVDLNPSAIAEGRRLVHPEAAIGQPFEQMFPDYRMLLEEMRAADELTRTVKLFRLAPPSLASNPLASSSLSGRSRTIFRAVKVRPIFSPGRRRIGQVVIIRDITLEKQQQAQLEEFAYVDSLTGLFNRRQLELKASEIFAPRLGSAVNQRGSIALLYIDLNHFKPINDAFGHDVGDAVLQHFAQCLRSSVRQGDMVVRLGGDEFAAVVYRAEQGVAGEVRSRLMKALAQPVTLLGHSFTLSASIGIAYYPKDGATLQALLRRADAQMYKEKRRSKRQSAQPNL